MCLVLWGPSCMWPLIVDLFCGCWLPCCRSSEKPRILKGKTAFTDILLSLRACYIHVLYRQDTRSMSTAKTLPYRPPSFRVSGISTLFFMFYFNFSIYSVRQVGEFSLPSLLRHHPLPGSGPLRLLYVGIWSAISPVCLECVLSQVVV